MFEIIVAVLLLIASLKLLGFVLGIVMFLLAFSIFWPFMVVLFAIIGPIFKFLIFITLVCWLWKLFF